MNIMVPISDIDMINELSEAGADEFYFGFYDYTWNRIYGNFEEINRMSSFGSKSNFDYNMIESVIKKIHSNKKKAFITFNSPSYSIEEIGLIKKYLNKIKQIGIDGIIVGDISLINLVLSYDLPVILSTMLGAYNSEIIKFYNEMGIKRIIIPRDVQIEDIEKMVKNFPNIDFEVFIMRNGCKYSDSNCMSFHSRKYGAMCSYIDNSKQHIISNCDNDFEYMKKVYENNLLFKQAFHKSACGICAIKRFLDMGIHSVKIVGRADNPNQIIRDVKLIKKNIIIANKSKDNNEYLKKIDFNESLLSNCLYKLNCYY